MKKTKVFGIGFHKTATTSLASALEQLGYKVTGPNGVNKPDIASQAEKIVYELAEKFDGFQDNPWPFYYKELDKKYPGSKFILTLRPGEKWIASLCRHFDTKVTPMRQWIYGDEHGCPVGNEQKYLDRYNKHNTDVIEYFKDRPDDLLVLKITEGEGWSKLCPFLNAPIQQGDFPRENLATSREKAASYETNIFKRMIKKITGQ